MNIEKLISEMTAEEKAAIVAGTDFMYTNPIPRLGIPSVSMADGPHGLRKQTGELDNGVSQSEPSTSFPTAVTTASGWNPENARRIGEAIGKECNHYGVGILLGPGVNIKRNPLCGRNFEYFSEDPLLAGEMGAAEVMGVQSCGVGVSLKHFAMNNSENYRFMGNSIADMRAIREIYLRAFERIVKKARPMSLMCAYNKINGTYCSQNKWLLTDILRGEWGFDGAVMTDWGAMHDRVESLKSGLDLEMPGDTSICRRWILDGLAEGTLSENDLDGAVKNVLRLVESLKKDRESEKADFDAAHILAGEIAADCAVLLKNDGLLPLSKQDKLLVIGDLFEKMRYQGAGSSMINPTRVTTPRNAFDAMGIDYTFLRGYAENRLEPDEKMIAEAVEGSDGFDRILVFAGLTDYVEGEGSDREDMRLPENQLALIERLIERGKKITVVLFGGSVIELPFADDVGAILNMFLPGQNGGYACASLLFGDKTPSGKLSETWVRKYSDVPFFDEFSKTRTEIYRESIFVGYRYYGTAKKQVRYPFGYGLSYTSFEYKNLSVTENGDRITVNAEIANVGKYDGAEVVQLYVKAPRTDIFKPEKELRGFDKVYVRAGECRQVSISFEKKELAYFNTNESRFVLESGEYELQICSDYDTVELSSVVLLDGERASSPYSEKVFDIYNRLSLSEMSNAVFEEMSGLGIPEEPPKRPIHLDSRFSDLQDTFMGRVLFKAVLSVTHRQRRRAQKMPEGPEKDNRIKGAWFLQKVLESSSLISMTMCEGRIFSYNAAKGVAELSNGHILRSIKCFLTPIRAPKLPKKEKKRSASSLKGAE